MEPSAAVHTSRSIEVTRSRKDTTGENRMCVVIVMQRQSNLFQIVLALRAASSLSGLLNGRQ